MDERSPPPEEPSSTSPQLDSSSAGDNPPPPPTTETAAEEDHSGADRASKRRKNCPESLDQIQETRLPNRTHSFTFDTKFSASPPEFTPKFGSFKLPAAEPEKDREDQAADGNETAEDGELEDEHDEDAVKVTGLVPVNGITEN